MNSRLLAAHDPSPVTKINPEGGSPYVLVGDHAGNLIPSRLQALGLAEVDLGRHIACDIGTGALGDRLAAALDCVFIRQVYSRLVVDCNRHAAAADFIAETSDGTPIPGNRGLSAGERAARRSAIYEPYHDAIAAELHRRDTLGLQTILVSLHSFTPVMNGFQRPWHVGVLHDGGATAYAIAVLQAFEAAGAHVVGDNEPYRMDDTDYTVPQHAYAAGRRYVELELRQDLLGSDEQLAEWTVTVSRALATARSALPARKTSN